MNVVHAMRPHRLIPWSLALWALVAIPAAAAPITAVEVAIQGVARDAAGLLIPAGNIAVRVYADSLGGAPLYDSAAEFNGAIIQGIFDVIVGRATPLMLDHDQSYFLELDVAGVEVVGDAAGGRQRFFPGGGSHTRTDLQSRLSLLEAAMGLSAQHPAPPPAERAGMARGSSRLAAGTGAVVALRATTAFSNQHALLGLGVLSGSAGGLTAAGRLLTQPIGVRTAGAVKAQLGPIYLFTPTTDPMIRFIHDVPGDQGRAVRIRWRNDQRERAYSPADTLPRITSYTVYRRVGAGQSPALRAQPTPDEVLSLPPGDWDVLTSIPATLDTSYQTVVPTLCDSTSAGICWSTFLVRAITDHIGLYHDAAADSGFSVDNLAPGVPGGLTVQPVAGGNQLSWQPSTAPDFQYFRVYRSTDPDFTPGPASLVHATATPGWLDPLLGSFTYKVTALDFNGNESVPAVAVVVLGVEPQMPKALTFVAMNPNPFRHELSLVVDVPRNSGRVDLALFDVMGRRVRSLVDAPLGPGRHTFAWDGSTDAGERAAPGVYLARLRGAGTTLTRRATLLP